MDIKSVPFRSIMTWHWAIVDTNRRDFTSLAAYVYKTLSLMTNHSLFPCFLLTFDLCKYPLMEELSVLADTSLRAAGIFFCFLEKAKVALVPGDTIADRACSHFCCWRTTKHWSQTRANWFFRYSRQCLLEEQAWHTTFPHARQWCRLHVRVNSQVQIIHMVVRGSGIHIGALDPKGTPSPKSFHSTWLLIYYYYFF